MAADAVRFRTLEPAYLTMAVTPPGTGTTDPPEGGPYTYTTDEIVPIQASATAGYQFDHWEVSAGLPVADPTAQATTVTMDQSKTVTALFVEQGPVEPEFRAFWADVFHYGLQDAAQIDEMIAWAVAGNYNAIIPEVLAYHDAEFGSHGAYWQSDIVTRSTYGFSAVVIIVAAFVSGLVVRRRLDHLDLVAVLKSKE